MNNIKKIAIIRSSYSPYGGVETLTADLLPKILDANITVYLLTFPHQNWPITHPRLKIIPLGTPFKNRLWKLWNFNRSVCNYLSNHSFEIVFSLDRVSYFTHYHAGGGSHISFLRSKAKNENILKRIFTLINIYHKYSIYIEKKGFNNPLLQKIHCCSNMVANDIVKEHKIDKKKLKVIYNGINWKLMEPVFKDRNSIGSNLLKFHDLNPSNNLLLFLGSGFSRKGLDIAIKGLDFLPESYHLIVVGKGDKKPYVRISQKLGLENRVHFLGPQQQGWRYASICKAMILPSRYEPFGLAAAEAQAMGLPVLVTENTGYAELVIPGINGIILKSNKDKDIKIAFIELREMIEFPRISASEIREKISNLDNDIITVKIIKEFLEL